jgi:hypothetical protein
VTTVFTPSLDPMPDWLQEALSHRHSTRAVIMVGLEDGRFAVLDEQLGPTKRNYLVCESLSDVEKELTGLRDRSLARSKPSHKLSVNAEGANALLRELGLLP